MNKLKILVLGANGQLGWEATRHFVGFADVFALDYPQVNFLQSDELINKIKSIKPDLIFNAVAYTAVDKAEEEIEIARAINAYTPGKIAQYCKSENIPFIHFSTDYVFDGKKGENYIETDDTNPLNEYGRSKLLGEEAILTSGCVHWIFRTSWVYSDREGGFLQKVSRWAMKNETLRIVDDQIGNPTWCRALANGCSLLLNKHDRWLDYIAETQGIYHLAGWGSASRYEWAKLILEYHNHRSDFLVKELIPVKSSEFPTPAERPLHAALDCSKFANTFGYELPCWQDSVKLLLS